MAQIQLKNFADTTISVGINAAATSISLAAGTGALFPALSAGDWFYGVLVDTSSNREIVKVTARATDTLTVTRAQEGTTALSFASGSVFSLRMTVQSFQDYMAALSSTYGVPSQTGNSNKFLSTNGTTASWQAAPTPVLFNNQHFQGL